MTVFSNAHNKTVRRKELQDVCRVINRNTLFKIIYMAVMYPALQHWRSLFIDELNNALLKG
jgi:hypothetical protein